MDLVFTALLGLTTGAAIFGIDIVRKSYFPSRHDSMSLNFRSIGCVGLGVLIACLITWGWSAMYGLNAAEPLSHKHQVLGVAWTSSIMIGGLAGARWHYVLRSQESNHRR